MSKAQLGKKNRPHTIEEKLIIGFHSKQRMNLPEMKLKIRLANEKAGRWTPLAELDSKKVYFKEANWIERMFDKLQDVDDLLKLKNLGVFNARLNKQGIVRDHMYTRRSGFLNGVFPEILRHPCNCKLLTNSENIGKKDDDYNDKDSQNLKILFEKIQNYSGTWKEQSLVLELINKYLNGERWVNKYRK